MMKAIEETALEVARELVDDFTHIDPALIVEFSTRFLDKIAEQSEPVAWKYKDPDPTYTGHCPLRDTPPNEHEPKDRWAPLYLHPPKPDAEVEKAIKECNEFWGKKSDADYTLIHGLTNTLRIVRESLGLPAESPDGGLDLQDRVAGIEALLAQYREALEVYAPMSEAMSRPAREALATTNPTTALNKRVAEELRRFSAYAIDDPNAEWGSKCEWVALEIAKRIRKRADELEGK